MRLILLLALAGVASAQAPDARLLITVVDSTEAPVAGAAVRVVGGDSPVTTDAGGHAERAIPSGDVVVVVEADGFEAATFTVSVPPGERAEGVVTLLPAPRLLGTVETVADRLQPELARVGFYERRAERRGEYVARDAFEQRSLHTVRDALVGTSGIRFITWDGARVAISTRSVTGADGALQNAKPCPLSVFVDGSEVPGETVDLEGYATADLAGIEVYVGTARTPPEYGRFNPCGVILLWSRVE